MTIRLEMAAKSASCLVMVINGWRGLDTLNADGAIWSRMRWVGTRATQIWLSSKRVRSRLRGEEATGVCKGSR